MARRPNYGYEKRQRELKRQKKKETRAERKRQKKEAAANGDQEEDSHEVSTPASVEGRTDFQGISFGVRGHRESPSSRHDANDGSFPDVR